jgi:hypothetical protein
VFLTDMVRYFGGASERVMIDNTHVVVLRGVCGRHRPHVTPNRGDWLIGGR